MILNIVIKYSEVRLKDAASTCLSNYLNSRMDSMDFLMKSGITYATIQRVLNKQVNDLKALKKLMNVFNDLSKEQIFRGI